MRKNIIQVLVIAFTGLIYSVMTSANPTIEYDQKTVFESWILTTSLFGVIRYFWEILAKCGDYGKKIQISIFLCLFVPFVLNFISIGFSYYGSENIARLLFYWRFKSVLVLIGLWSIFFLPRKDPSQILLWLSGFAERYKG